MATLTYRGVVRGGLVLLETETPIPDGTEVIVTPVGGAVGSSAAVLAAMDAAPAVPAEWVDELEELIAQGRRPPARFDLFSDEAGSQESP